MTVAPAPSQERIEAIVQKTHFSPETVEQVLHLQNILSSISGDEISKELVLIGGTAINLTQSPPPRLSVDLDIDYVGNPSLGLKHTEEIKKKQFEHQRILDKIVNKLGYQLSKNEKSSKERLLSLNIYDGKRMVVLIELGYIYCSTVAPYRKLRFNPLDGDKIQAPFDFNVTALEELWASKLVACIFDRPVKKDVLAEYGITRNKIRHLYDVYHLSKLISENPDYINMERLLKIFVLFGVTRINNFFHRRGEVIERYEESEMDTILRPMLRSGERVLTLEEAKSRVRQFFDSHIFGKYEDSDYGFIGAFNKSLFQYSIYFKKHPDIVSRVRNIAYFDDLMGLLK